MIEKFLAENTAPVKAYLNDFLRERSHQLIGVNRWGDDLCQRLISFCTSGKMLRAGLVRLAHDMYQGASEDASVKAAAALELIHSSILIHDDIMDQDIQRRGNETVHQQYCSFGQNKSIIDPHHFGISMGICAGDIGFFLAYEILSQLSVEPAIRNKILETFNKELVNVGLAQMQDVYFCNDQWDCNEEDILSLYLFKTARYTFSLPLITGALLCDIDENELQNLVSLGMSMGILFQIKDDELDIFGTEKHLGKSIGSDIQQGKKTLHLYYLYQAIPSADKEKLTSLLLPNKSNEAIDTIRTLIDEYRIQEKVGEKITEYTAQAEAHIDTLSVDNRFKDLLHHLLEFIVNRKR